MGGRFGIQATDVSGVPIRREDGVEDLGDPPSVGDQGEASIEAHAGGLEGRQAERPPRGVPGRSAAGTAGRPAPRTRSGRRGVARSARGPARPAPRAPGNGLETRTPEGCNPAPRDLVPARRQGLARRPVRGYSRGPGCRPPRPGGLIWPPAVEGSAGRSLPQVMRRRRHGTMSPGRRRDRAGAGQVRPAGGRRGCYWCVAQPSTARAASSTASEIVGCGWTIRASSW